MALAVLFFWQVNRESIRPQEKNLESPKIKEVIS